MPKSGTGRIYQQAGSATWWIDYGHRGKRFRESTKSLKRSDATKLLKKRLGEIGSGTFVGPKAERLGFDQLVGHLEADYRKNQRRTWDRTELSIVHLRKYFGSDRAGEITTGRMNAYILSRQDEGAAQATIRRELAALSRMFSLAIENGELNTKPKIPTLKVNNTRAGFLDGADLDTVIAELPDYLRPVVRFAAHTGWRRGEVLALKWSQVDLDSGMIRLEPGTTKNDEGRLFPFGALPALASLLEEQREQTRALQKERGEFIPHVFHRDGSPIKDLRAAWASACQRAGVPGMLFHDLRRTGVRDLVRAGVPEKTAMKLVGHKTRSIFDRYNIVNEADLVAGVEKLAKMHAAKGEEARTVHPIGKRAIR